MGFLFSKQAKTSSIIEITSLGDSGVKTGSEQDSNSLESLSFKNTAKLSAEEARSLIKSTWNAIERSTKHARNEKLPKDNFSRTIRIFVSSTFSDFHSEREFLAKEVFPEIRELCSNYGLSMVEIDLRWGVPSEASSSETISICMEEIERCCRETNDQPFFISFLGNRYGWIPSNSDMEKNFIEKYHWISNVSITHMEILRGAYWNDNPNAIFFFRNPSSLSMIPSENRTKFLDGDAYSKAQMEELKDRLLAKFPNRCFRYSASFCGYEENTSNSKIRLGNFDNSFTQEVSSFLKQQIEVYAKTHKSDTVDAESAAHLYFAEQMCKNFVSRTNELDSLLQWFQKTKPNKSIAMKESFTKQWGWLSDKSELHPLAAVSGGKGCGKSALLAQFAYLVKERYPDVVVFVHFSGTPTEGTMDATLLQRLISLASLADPSLSKTMTIDKPLRVLQELWINEKAKELIEGTRQFLLILDGLDQLDGNVSAQHLDWLPPACTLNMKILVSFRTEHMPTVARISDRLCSQIDLKPLTKNEQKQFVKQYLKEIGKQFDNVQMDSLLAQDRSPDWLALALEELRVFGLFADLNKKIENLSPSLDDLFWQIAQRIFNEPFVDKATLQNVVALMACSPNGLEGKALQRLLSTSNDVADAPLSAIEWVKIKRLFKSFFRFNNDDYVTWAADSFKQTAKRRLFVAPDIEIGYHKQLANYYAKHSNNIHQICRQYPHHLLASKQPEALVSFLFKDRRSMMTPLHLKREYLLELKCNAMVVDIHPDVGSSLAYVCAFCNKGKFHNNCIFCGMPSASRSARLCTNHSFGHKKCLLCGNVVDIQRLGHTVFKASLCDWCKGHGVDHCSWLPVSRN